ncbi:MAG: Pseudouridine synthase [Sporanaerobacter sp.]|uniref:RluA family pseudouridine synthase n=1 Tax=Sporanaerobacter sp. TaxID=2010183 RepID=UPI003A0FD5C4
MREIIVDTNESNQRIDRFLKKYLSKASQGTIYKMIRKKRIKLNNKRANPEDIIVEGDSIQFYISDEVLDKFIEEKKEINSFIVPRIIYEDKNIIFINKPVGMLSHSANKEYGDNVVDSMISYLIKSGEYNPRLERTFTPSICNRLDRNTSGIVIGAKNYEALKDINNAIKSRSIKKYYKCMVKGTLKEDILLEDYLLKNEDKNKVKVVKSDVDGAKKISTYIKVLKKSNEFSLLEIDLITGRTHQIRAHLSHIGHPIVGDVKYGDANINKNFREKYNLNSQFLHAYKIAMNGLIYLDYLNGKEFVAELPPILEKIERDWF